MKHLLAALPCMVPALGCGAPLPGCLPAEPVPIRVRIGADAAPVDALLRGGASPALQLVERDTGRVLWSAGATAPVAQQFAAMRAGFAGSLAAIDLDDDGVHDRLYAGDLAARLWRFDLHHGVPAGSWASGGIYADFSNMAGRAFLAAPDVSLATAAGKDPWFNIGLGTAAPEHATANNRYYMLRDHAPFEAWSDEDYRNWRPVREADLVRTGGSGAVDEANAEHGWFIELVHGDVLQASVTVAGRAVLAIAESIARPANGCRVAVTIASFDASDGHATGTTHTDQREALPAPVASSAGFAWEQPGDDGVAICTLDGLQVAACNVDTRPVKTWWRREDAE